MQAQPHPPRRPPANEKRPQADESGLRVDSACVVCAVCGEGDDPRATAVLGCLLGSCLASGTASKPSPSLDAVACVAAAPFLRPYCRRRAIKHIRKKSLLLQLDPLSPASCFLSQDPARSSSSRSFAAQPGPRSGISPGPSCPKRFHKPAVNLCLLLIPRPEHFPFRLRIKPRSISIANLTRPALPLTLIPGIHPTTTTTSLPSP
jgi:hypothetical protein